MSETPMTDAVAKKWINEQPNIPDGEQSVKQFVKTLFNHSRDLETRLAAANARVVELEAALRNLTDAADELGRVCNRGECDDQIKVARDLLAMKG